MADGFIQVDGGRVWYRRQGEGSGTPIVLLHGGPGFSSLGSEALGALGDERPVIWYDQLGSGRSERPADASLWTVARFVKELAQVRAALKLDEMHLLGHSWGTMLAASYLLDSPGAKNGVKSVTFSSPCLSAPRWERDQKNHIKSLPKDVQQVISDHEAAGTTDSKAYQDAMMVFYKRFVCRLDPWPEVMDQSMESANLQIYQLMWGPSEFCPTGTLRGFDVTDRLSEIQLPALFLCGRYDESTPETTQEYSRLIENSEFHVFEHSGHMTQLEEPEPYVRVLRDFLRRHD
jgi:proline iminopeptidase